MQAKCTIEDCPYPIRTRSYCSRHYQRLMKFGDPLGSRVEPRVCVACGELYRAIYGTQKYCSPTCRKVATVRTYSVPAETRLYGISPSTLGTLREMLVAIDLMRRGFDVFKAMSPNSPCDLVALRGDSPALRIEVKTAVQSPVTGKVAVPRPRHNCDLLGLVVGDAIHYADALGNLSREPIYPQDGHVISGFAS